MKALVKAHAEPGLWMQTVEPPEVAVNEVMIKVKKTAICGTDLHIYKWDEWARNTVPVPLIIGHEFCGEIVEVGPGVTDFKVGDRVSGEGHLTCGYCRNCRAGVRHLCRNTEGIGYNVSGCFAEYFTLAQRNVFLLPDSISDSEAACLDPFGNATHTALAFDLVGEDVLITGAGPVGLMAALIAKQAGARHVVVSDINPYRLELARRTGASRVINPMEDSLTKCMRDLGMTEGFDVGMEMSGSGDAVASMLSAMNHGGRVALLGLMPSGTGIDWTQVVFKSITLKGIYGRKIFETWYKMTNLLQSGLDLSSLITHHFSVDDFEAGFQLMASGQCGKVVLDWEK